MSDSARLCRVLTLAACACGLPGVVGCSNPDSVVGFQERDPAARLRAILQASANSDRAAIPDLIHALESDDAAERLLSIRALEKMTGQTLGYDHAASVDKRRESAQRWALWYSQQPGMTTQVGRAGGRT